VAKEHTGKVTTRTLTPAELAALPSSPRPLTPEERQEAAAHHAAKAKVKSVLRGK
jgi:hypothetical protein